MECKTEATVLKPIKSKGFTLFHVLVIVSLLSVLSLIYANSDKSFNEERMAALTIARVHSLLALVYSTRDSLTDSGWVGACNNSRQLDNLDDFGLTLDGWQNLNGFGYPFLVHESSCKNRLFTLYYYVPMRWAEYIVNHLESTFDASDIADSFGSGAGFFDAAERDRYGLVALATTVDIYGNLKNGTHFVRRNFETTGATRNSDIRSGVTDVTILKPECAGKVPRIHYTVSGICSYYPHEYHDPENMDALIADDSFDFDENDRYRTYGFEYRLENRCTDASCLRNNPWRIALFANERWGTTETVSVGDTTTTVRGEDETAASPSIDVCMDGNFAEVNRNTKIDELLEIRGDMLGDLHLLTQFLDRFDLFNHFPGANGLGRLNILGESYDREDLLDMRIREFEDEFDVSLEDYTVSSRLTIDAWITCVDE